MYGAPTPCGTWQRARGSAASRTRATCCTTRTTPGTTACSSACTGSSKRRATASHTSTQVRTRRLKFLIDLIERACNSKSVSVRIKILWSQFNVPSAGRPEGKLIRLFNWIFRAKYNFGYSDTGESLGIDKIVTITYCHSIWWFSVQTGAGKSN